MYDAIAIAAADFDNFLNDFANFLLPKSVMDRLRNRSWNNGNNINK